MMFLPDDKQADIIDAFNTTPRHYDKSYIPFRAPT